MLEHGYSEGSNVYEFLKLISVYLHDVECECLQVSDFQLGLAHDVSPKISAVL